MVDLYDNFPLPNQLHKYSVDSFNAQNEVNLTRNFFILHQNIRSFSANYDYLAALLDSLSIKPSVLVLSETWFTSGNCHDIFGYNSHHIYRENRMGGGISVFVDNRFKFSVLSDKCICTDAVEVSTVSLNVGFDTIINIVGVYRPPTGCLDSFSDVLFNQILYSFNPNALVFVCGDLNFDFLNPDDSHVGLIDNFYSLSYSQLIHDVTRPNNNEGSCIDHIWSNYNRDHHSGVLDVLITDHYPIFTVLRLSPIRNSVLKHFRDHSASSLSSLKEDVLTAVELLRSDVSVDVNQRVSSFSETLLSLYDRSCPIRSKIVSRKRFCKPWISDQLLININRKHALYRDFRRGLVDFNLYKVYRNKLKVVLKQSKMSYFHGEFVGSARNSRSVWSTVNVLLRGESASTHKSEPEPSDFQQESVDSDLDLANHFNNYFSTVGSLLVDSANVDGARALDYMGDRQLNSLYMSPCDASEVEQIISSLANKSSPLNCVPTFIFKWLKQEISPVISELFNLSVHSGVFPKSLKIARVIPIYKSGDKSNVTNYRPISILSVLSKIFERLAYTRLVSYLQKFGILKNNQFGFRKLRSTSDAILEFLNDAYVSLENRSQFVAVCIDLSKAFDTVNHDVLLRKLSHIGVRASSYDWFASYLSDRSQYVSIRGTHSDIRFLDAGVPQGSVLGPLLFLIYINEMSNICHTVKFIHYADDTTIYFSHTSIEVVIAELTLGLGRLEDWLLSNYLVLNANKTNCLLISNNVLRATVPPLMIRNTRIQLVESLKFLGVIVDEKLNFKEQTSLICRRVSRSVGMIRKVSEFVSGEVLVTLYYSLIQSHLAYGILAWGNSSVGNVEKVKRCQRRFFRILSDSGMQCKLFDFGDLYVYFSLLKFVQCTRYNMHEYFDSLFGELMPRHDHRTRFVSCRNLYPPTARLSKTHRSFFAVAIKNWNLLPEYIRILPTYFKFKRELKNFLL